jgi:hypothetical protein
MFTTANRRHLRRDVPKTCTVATSSRATKHGELARHQIGTFHYYCCRNTMVSTGAK